MQSSVGSGVQPLLRALRTDLPGPPLPGEWDRTLISGAHPSLLLLEHGQLPLVHSRGAGAHGRQPGFGAHQLRHRVSGHSPPDGSVDSAHGPEHCRGGGRRLQGLAGRGLSWSPGELASAGASEGNRPAFCQAQNELLRVYEEGVLSRFTGRGGRCSGLDGNRAAAAAEGRPRGGGHETGRRLQGAAERSVTECWGPGFAHSTGKWGHWGHEGQGRVRGATEPWLLISNARACEAPSRSGPWYPGGSAGEK